MKNEHSLIFQFKQWLKSEKGMTIEEIKKLSKDELKYSELAIEFYESM